jgi:hypothetical protein
VSTPRVHKDEIHTKGSALPGDPTFLKRPLLLAPSLLSAVSISLFNEVFANTPQPRGGTHQPLLSSSPRSNTATSVILGYAPFRQGPDWWSLLDTCVRLINLNHHSGLHASE